MSINFLQPPPHSFHVVYYCVAVQNEDAPTRPASMASGSTVKVSDSKDSKLSHSPSTDSHLSNSEATSMMSANSQYSYSKDETGSLDKHIDTTEGPEINEVVVKFVKYPDECCPQCCLKRSRCCEIMDRTYIGSKFWTYRCYMFKLVEHKYFETFIIVMILLSSLALVRRTSLTSLDHDLFCVNLTISYDRIIE